MIPLLQVVAGLSSAATIAATMMVPFAFSSI
jgi:hypothetical protein